MLTGPFAVIANGPLECVQSLSRVEACPNMVYRGVDKNQNGQLEMFCFCKTDMTKLFAKNVSDTQKALNKMELRELLVKFDYTEQQLLNLIKN